MTTATALAGRILKFIENEDVQQDALEVSPASLSLQVLKYVVDTLDGRIAETKFQIENHVVTHEDAFRELIQRSAKIRQGTAEVMHGIEELSRIIDDPEIGLSVQLERALTEKEILNEEYQRVDLSIQLLSTLTEISNALDEYHQCISVVDYSGALSTVERLSHSGEALPQDLPFPVPLFTSIAEKIQSVGVDIRSRLEYVVSQGLLVQIDDERSKIVVTQQVTAPGLGPRPVPLRIALEAIQTHQLQLPHLRPFVRMLHKHVLLPVAKLERVVASRQHENGVSDLELALASGRPSSNELDDVLESLSVILTFLAETVVPSIPIFHVLGSISYPQIAELVISQYLEKLIPDDLDGLKEFEIVAAKCRDFEARLADMGTVFNGDRPLSRYVEHAPLHFIIKKHHKLVSQARDILFRKGVDTLQVDERPSRHLQDALQEQVTALCRAAQVEPISLPVLDLPPNLFHFPKCTISSKARDLTKLLEGILADVTSLNTSAAKHLYKTLHTILELALALLPPPEPYAIPHLAMVLYNDCMWIMHQCIILHAKERETGLVRFVPEFRNLACKIWGQQMTSQCQQLSIHIRSSNGFDCHLPGRLPIVQKALKRAELLITQLAKVWKDTLPRHVYCQTLGDLLSHTITAICGEVLALEDIAEQESVALWNMLGEFAKIVDVTFTFETKAVDQASAQSETPPEQLANIYVRNLKRFSLITEILNMPLVKIHQNFQAHVYDGALERHELRRLVMALFAETDTRRGVLRDLETS